jgi:deoxyribonuclease V
VRNLSLQWGDNHISDKRLATSVIIPDHSTFANISIPISVGTPHILAVSEFVIALECFIIQKMKVFTPHEWEVSTARAREIQSDLARKVVTENNVVTPRFIAGIDMSSGNAEGTARGAVVVLNYPELDIIEVKVAEARITFPYVPGLLSFRECPLIVAACEKLDNVPDIILIDGQGIAHPRRLGLASHVGLLLDLPTIGCAKSILCGEHLPVGEDAGSYAELLDKTEVIGAALRTKSGVKPVYVSVGHKIDLASALHWVTRCCRGYRLPEPTRLAHLAAGGTLTAGSGCQAKSYR